MIIYENDLKDLENYTFSKHWDNTNNLGNFSQINSYTNNFILNYQPINNINNKVYNNSIKIYKKSNLNINKEKEKDINYNELNISSKQRNSIKNNNINNINNINIISYYKNKNKIRNYNHIDSIKGNNINNLNSINNDLYKKKSISKDNKIENRCKYNSPDKYMNYNNFNHITPDVTRKRNRLYNNDPKMSSDKNNQMVNKINYNESIRRKTNYRKIKKALTPDITNNKKIRNFKNLKNNIPNNKNYKNLYLKPINFSNNNNYNINIKKTINDSYKDINLKYNNLSFGNSENQIGNNFDKNRDNYYEQNININNINNNINNFNNKSNNNNSLNPVMNSTNEYLKYSQSCFNNRLPRGSKPPILNKNLIKSASCNKTPSPVRKNNPYIPNSFYNVKNKKLLRCTRSSSADNIKESMNKLKNIFRFKNYDSNYCPDTSSLDNYNKNLNKSCLSQHNFLNSRTYNKNSFYSSNSNSCGFYNSSLYNNISKNNTSNINDKNYNKEQTEFNKSLYSLGYLKDINKIFSNSEYNIINKENNNFNINDFKYKYNNKYSQSYNYQSYIESYNNESIKENLNNNTSNNNYKSEICNKYNISTLNKYDFNNNNNKSSLSIGNSIKNINYYTKLSTNNNSFDDNSNNSYTSWYKYSKRNRMDTIEEIHLNLVNILQNRKNMVRNQESMAKDKIIYNYSNSSVIFVEERDIE